MASRPTRSAAIRRAVCLGVVNLDGSHAFLTTLLPTAPAYRPQAGPRWPSGRGARTTVFIANPSRPPRLSRPDLTGRGSSPHNSAEARFNAFRDAVVSVVREHSLREARGALPLFGRVHGGVPRPHHQACPEGLRSERSFHEPLPSLLRSDRPPLRDERQSGVVVRLCRLGSGQPVQAQERRSDQQC